MDNFPINETFPPIPETKPLAVERDRRQSRIGHYWALLVLISFLFGNASGFWVNESRHAGQEADKLAHEAQSESEMAHLASQVNPPQGYQVQATFGELGPKLLAAGAMNYDVFLQVYEQAGAPLTEKQVAILTQDSHEQIVIDTENAYFLLNFFWALGLTNHNPILTEGPMVTNSQGQVENYASTGGWSIAAKPISELYASAEILSLTPAQQEHLDHVVQNVFRPCCNNPTHFPDCNHGMAMLGLLTLMVSQGASEDEMFEAAKYANAFWYPNQTMEVAIYFKAALDIDFKDADARQVVSRAMSSGSGFQAVHEWLASNSLLQQGPSGGSSCGV